MTELRHGPITTPWTKSSFSSTSQGCLQVRWVKSSFSSGSQGCVQVRPAGADRVEVGDTKDPDGPTLLVPEADWQRFLDQVADGAADYTGRLQPRFLPDGGFTLSDAERSDSPVLTYTKAEWDAFDAGVRAGELRAVAA